MAEYFSNGFYDKSKWTNSYYAVMICLEKYIAANIFRGDVSRVFFASDSYSFRRRYELTDSSQAYENIKASSLQFPFCNYWYSGSWDYDDRSASVQTPQIMFGSLEDGASKKLRAIAVKSQFSSTFYFNRDDDARLAYEYLMWDRSPSRIIRLAESLEWDGQKILLPVYVTVDNLDFNSQFTENDWLKNNRIVPIKMSFTVRSYIIYPEAQEKLSSGGVDSILRDDPASLYVTEQVLLDFFATKDLETNQDIYADMVEAYFDPDYDITIDSTTLSNIVYNGFDISWSVTDTGDVASALDYVKIIVSGNPVVVVPGTQFSYHFTGLTENTSYNVTLLFYLKSGKIYDRHLTLTTANDASTNPKDIGPIKGTLKGLTF
jgi:hypothetical protein